MRRQCLDVWRGLLSIRGGALSAFGPRRLQEKLRADKKAEILDRMRRKRQEEEEKREKDEIAAQKQREIEAEKQAASGESVC